MKREEERNKAALEAYPEAISYSTLIEDNIDYNKDHRDIWLEGAEWADKTIIDKQLKTFCYINCTEPMKKGVECKKPCKDFLILKRMLEE